MKTSNLLARIFLWFFISKGLLAYSQNAEEKPGKLGSPKKKQTQMAKEKARKEKEQAKFEEAAKKKHLNLQSKETRRRMKRNMKMTTAKHDGKQEIFFVRWFKKRK
jgi:hypothetical protein